MSRMISHMHCANGLFTWFNLFIVLVHECFLQKLGYTDVKTKIMFIENGIALSQIIGIDQHRR